MTTVSYYLGYLVILSTMHYKIRSSSGLVQMWHSLKKRPSTFRDGATTAWFPYEMTPEKQAQKCHTDNPSLPRSGQYFWLVAQSEKFASTNQMHQPDLGSDSSSVWNFYARLSDVVSRGNQWWLQEMSAIFPGQIWQYDSLFLFFACWRRFFVSFFCFLSTANSNQSVSRVDDVTLHLQVAEEQPLTKYFELFDNAGGSVSE